MEKVVDNTPEKTTNYRFERKFIYTGRTPEDIIATEVLGNSFCFSEIFHRRTVNNIYFDDPAMTFYHQNVAGDDKRNKYRLRWYGDQFEDIKNPVVEIKKKHGAVGDKLSFPIPETDVTIENQSLAQIKDALLSEIEKQHPKTLAEHMSVLSPSLFNSYERRYFLSHCEKFRITIDYNMVFFNPKFPNFLLSKTTLPDVVLELKYEVANDKKARSLSQELSARLSKNSKYVRGVDLIHHITTN